MSLTNREGQRVPDVAVQTLSDTGLENHQTGALFAGKKVAVFSLPGAFTPTCSSSHVPRYQELFGDFRAAGVDAVFCVSVNDAFVMKAWQADQGAPDILFLADGNGDFTREMGMLVDKRGLGFGERSWRYSMFVNDGTIEKMFIEPEVPGDPFEVSDADTMLAHVAGEGAKAEDIVLVTKPGCAHCARAKAALAEAGKTFEEIAASPRRLKGLSGRTSTPQVFVNGQYIGGADELIAHLKA